MRMDPVCVSIGPRRKVNPSGQGFTTCWQTSKSHEFFLMRHSSRTSFLPFCFVFMCMVASMYRGPRYIFYMGSSLLPQHKIQPPSTIVEEGGKQKKEKVQTPSFFGHTENRVVMQQLSTRWAIDWTCQSLTFFYIEKRNKKIHHSMHKWRFNVSVYVDYLLICRPFRPR